MREIEYRGKRKDNEQWIYGNLIRWGDNRYSIMPIPMHVELAFSNYEVIPETVGQYTCLKDKNGVKIYEGYILNHDGDLWLVKYLEEDGMFVLIWENITENFSNMNSKWFEVIGNIYDNPELLEGE